MSGAVPDTFVREAVVGDAAAIAAIGRVAFPEAHRELIGASTVDAIVEQTYSLAALRECIRRCAQADEAQFLLAERGSRVVGYLHYDCEGARA